jgi:hypothetical protein
MDPMTILGIGSAVAGGVSSIFGGQAQGAAIRRQNREAHQKWIQANTQKTINNSREQFQATYAFEQQLKRNRAIAENAYAYQFDAQNATKYNYALAQNQMGSAMQSQRASLIQAITAKGISSSSGMYGVLAASQALNALTKAGQLDVQLQQQKKEIDKQFKGMMSQQTENIFMPNIQLYDESPIFGDAGAAETAGLVSGLVQIGGAVAAAAMPTKSASDGGSTFNPNEGTNSFNTNLDSYNSGGTFGGGYNSMYA